MGCFAIHGIKDRNERQRKTLGWYPKTLTYPISIYILHARVDVVG